MFLSQYTLMSVCMRSAETAFQIGETGSSLGPAPAPQNRLPPLGSDCCTNSMCLCHSSLGPLPLCMLPWSACSQERCVSDYVVLQRERKAAGVPTSGTAGVSSCRMNTVVFTRSPICSMRAWGGFEFNLCYPEDLYSHLNCFLTSINPAGTAVNSAWKYSSLFVCVCIAGKVFVKGVLLSNMWCPHVWGRRRAISGTGRCRRTEWRLRDLAEEPWSWLEYQTDTGPAVSLLAWLRPPHCRDTSEHWGVSKLSLVLGAQTSAGTCQGPEVPYSLRFGLASYLLQPYHYSHLK